MPRTKMTRCALLERLGAAAALAPLVPLLDRDAEAQPRGAPKRLVLWFIPTGSVLSLWRPTGGETDFALSEILKPLEPWRSHLLIVDGVSHVAGGSAMGNHPHGRGMSWCWSASWPGKDGPGQDSPIKGTSLDQYVASRVGAGTKFRSLQLGVTSGRVGTGDSARYASMVNYTRVPNEVSLYVVYDRLFKDLVVGPADTSAFDKLRAQRKSAIDLARAEIAALTPRLGADERQKLQAHLAALRELEARMQSPTLDAACQRPPAPDGRLEVNTTWENMPPLGRMQMDLAAATLACDLTRVVNLQWACNYPQNHYPFIGVDVHHHETSHQGTGNATATRQLVTINNWYSQQLAGFMDRLAKIRHNCDNDAVWCGPTCRAVEGDTCTRAGCKNASGQCLGFIDNGCAQNGACGPKCGGRGDLVPPLDPSGDPISQRDQVLAILGRLDEQSYGGIAAWGKTPTGCTLDNVNSPVPNNSAYHYMSDVKTRDTYPEGPAA